MTSIGPRLYLDSLSKLGLSPAQAKELKKEIQEKASEKVDPFNYVPLSVVETYGKALKIPTTNLAQLFAALAPSKGTPVVAPMDVSAFPEPTLSVGASTTFAKGDGLVPASELSGYKTQLESLLKKPIPAEGMNASELQAILQEKGFALAHHPSSETGLTRTQVEQLFSVVARHNLPEHKEQEALVTLRSHRTALGEKGGAKFFHEQGWSGFSLIRAKGDGPGTSGFKLQAMRTDHILVALPKDATMVIIDAQGNERAGHLKATERTIDGKKESLVSIARSNVSPFGEPSNGKASPFTVRILDKAGKVLGEQLMSFGPPLPIQSKVLLHGTFQTQSKTTDPKLAWALDHGAPTGSKSSVPVGQRPAFSIDGGKVTGDSLVIDQDGQRVVAGRLTDLLCPPRNTPQAFKVGNLTYTLSPTSIIDLDDNPHGRLPGRIQSSSGADGAGVGASFDPNLHLALQARWGVGGITLSDSGGKVLGGFDPLDPAQDLNQRTIKK